jgi:hypothetical protein
MGLMRRILTVTSTHLQSNGMDAVLLCKADWVFAQNFVYGFLLQFDQLHRRSYPNRRNLRMTDDGTNCVQLQLPCLVACTQTPGRSSDVDSLKRIPIQALDDGF